MRENNRVYLAKYDHQNENGTIRSLYNGKRSEPRAIGLGFRLPLKAVCFIEIHKGCSKCLRPFDIFCFEKSLK